MTEERQIDYEALLHEAFCDAQRTVIRNILSKVAEQGLPGEHHFYITFNTTAPGVSIAPRLQKYTQKFTAPGSEYPDDMMIVLQHRFWDLFVQADRFEVKLTFDSIRERLVVPLSAIRLFFDPSVPYGLQFDDVAQDRRSSSMGEVMGFTSGRSGARASGRTQGERGERPVTERKKPARKPKGPPNGDPPNTDPASRDGVDDDLASHEKAPLDRAKGSGAGPAAPSGTVSSPSITLAKPGPRLVEPTGDSPKVVSLDQFRKK